MKKVVCLSVLVFLLCSGIAFASSKFEGGLFFGSYQPSFSTINQTFRIFKLETKNTQGFSLSYQINPTLRARLQLEYFESVAQDPYSVLGIRLETVAVSMLGVYDLFQFQNYKLYGGIGLIDYRVRSRVKNWPAWLGNPPTSEHNFGFPWGSVVLFGISMPINKFYQIKGEIHYVTGTDGELFDTPLDWDGFKYLISIGMNL